LTHACRQYGNDMERLLCDLKIVSSLRVGDRISQSGGALLIMHPSFLGSLWRAARGESRYTSVSAVTACFGEALVLGDEYTLAWKRSLNSDGQPSDAVTSERLRNRAVHLVSEIEAAVLGLRHLKLTYADDLSVSARINVLMDKIITQSNIFKDILGISRVRSPSLGHLNSPGDVLILSLTSV
jgi:hypothetical protein